MTRLSLTLLEVLQETQPLLQRLRALIPRIVVAAQTEYNAWDQNEDGEDEELGTGGICDAIASSIASILAGAGIDCVDGGQEGDDHAFLYAYDDTEAYEVDIPPQIYERGGGCSWKKIPDVEFEAGDVSITRVNRRDVLGESLTERFNPTGIFWYRGSDLPQVFGNVDTDGNELNYHRLGPGWYLTTDPDDAATYGKVNKFTLDKSARILTKNTRRSTAIVKSLVMRAPDLKEIVWDWDTSGNGNVAAGVRYFLAIVMRQDMHEIVQQVQVDFYRHHPDEFVREVAKVFDVMIDEPFESGVRHMVAYNLKVLRRVE